MSAQDDCRETFISETREYDGKLFQVGRRMVRLPNGREAERELVYHKGAAAIVPVDENGWVTLVRQYRVAHDTRMLEIPAGKLDHAGEDALACARRELREETGLTAREMQLLIHMIPTPGYLTEYVNIYLATGLTPGDMDPDEDEFLCVERMPLAEAAAMAMRGELQDAKTAIGILMAARLLL